MVWGGRLFTGLWRHHYLSGPSGRAGDVIPAPMANDGPNCLRLALYGNGQADCEQLWNEARQLGTVGSGIF